MIAAKLNSLKTVPGIIMVIMAICAFAGSAAAKQQVILVTGEIMTVDQAQVKDGRVWITWNGLSLSIAEKDVLRIESDGKNHIIVQKNSSPSQPEPSSPEAQNPAPGEIASQRKPQTKYPPAKRSAPKQLAGKSKLESRVEKKTDPSEPEELSTSAEQLLTYLASDGFGDIKWGDLRKAQTGLKRLYKDSELPDVIEYVRPTDSIHLGSDANTAIIKYAFWKNRLYMVTLWASGPEAFHSIRQAMVDKFGQGIPKPGSPQTYYWIDDDADRMVEYLEEKDIGLLWMRSRQINNQYKLSRLRIPIRAGQGSPVRAVK